MCNRHVRVFVASAAVAASFAVWHGGARAAIQTLYDSGDPTGDEQLVLEMINRARANPTAEGQRLHLDINEGLPAGQTAVPRPPLAMNKDLLAAARAHSLDMYTRKFFAHVNPDGTNPAQRITAAGYSYTGAGENIAAASKKSAAGLEDLLMIDLNYPGRGHRVNLLGTDPAGPQFREVGIGHYAGAVGITGAPEPYLNGLKDFLTEDFGTRAVGPFVLGVVYMDTDHDGFYDPGEGLAGVSVAPDSGDFFAVTGAAGGFAFPVGTGGTINVTASGGALTEPMQTQIVLTGVNAKADFVVPPPPKVTPKVLNLGFNFRPAKADTLKLVANVANVELPADLTGLSVTVTLGRVTRTFVLDAAGKATSGDARVVVKRGKGFAPHKVTFTLKGSDITGTTPFTAEGMDGLTAAKNVIVPLAGSIDLGTGPVALAANVKYNAKVAKNGSAVLKK